MSTIKTIYNYGHDVSTASTMEEAIQMAGLGWDTRLEPLYLADGTQIKGNAAVVRNDNNGVLGCVGKDYMIVQNKQAFNFFDDVLADGKAQLISAGSLKGGKRVFINARMADCFKVKHDDWEKRLTLSTSHDGTASVKISLYAMRIICSNGLIGIENHTEIRVKHVKSAADKMAEAQRAIREATHHYNHIQEQLAVLAETEVTPAQFEKYLDILLPVKNDSKRTITMRDTITDIYMNKGIGLADHRNTAYGALNAVLEFTDHHRSSRKSDESPEAVAFNSALFGGNYQTKKQAYNAIFEVIAQ